MLQEAFCRLPSLMARLNAATAVVYDDRQLLPGQVSSLDYRLFLMRLYGFHSVVEPALAAFRPLSAIVVDAGLRNHKAALLAHDLVGLGVDRREVVQLPRMRFTPPSELPEALGWTYVLERATLRGKLLARRIARHLPDEIARASAYLGCYGDEAVTRWRELGDAVDGFALGRLPAAVVRARGPAVRATPDAVGHTERTCERVVEAARDGALQLHRWMGPVLQPRSSQRHA